MKSPILRALGMNVCRLRTDRLWSQETLAEKLGVSVRQIQRIEAGGPNSKFLLLFSIATALGCDWNQLTVGFRKLRTARPPAEVENVHA